MRKIEDLEDVLGYISKNSVWGINLDFIAHFTISMIITLVMIKLKMKIKNMFIIMLILTVIKEIYDSPVMTYKFIDSIKDGFTNFIFLGIYVCFKLFRNRSVS